MKRLVLLAVLAMFSSGFLTACNTMVSQARGLTLTSDRPSGAARAFCEPVMNIASLRSPFNPPPLLPRIPPRSARGSII